MRARRPARRPLSIVLVLAVLASAGCVAPPPPGSSIELGELLPTARVGRESGRLLPFAAGAEGRSGFEQPRHDLERRWSVGDSSTLDLFLAAPRDLVLRLTGWPLGAPGAPPQEVRVEVNGRAVAAWRMSGGHETHDVPVAGRFWRAGVNRIVLRYAYTLRPVDFMPGNGDARELAVLWDAIEVIGAAEPDPRLPRRLQDPDGVLLAAGSRVDFFADLPPNAALEIGEIRAWRRDTTAVPRLEVEVRSLSAALPARFVLGGADTARRRRLPIPGRHRGPARVRLTVAGDGAGLRVFGLRLTGTAPLPPRATAPAARAAAPAARPHVLVYLVDTLRADHLGAYGYGRPTSPQVDALAADGVVFEAAVAQSSWTRPTVASLLTGLHPQVHGANGRDDALAPELPRLSTTLRDAGYRTAAFFTNGNAGPNFGFAEGFDDVEYFRERKTPRIHVPAEEVTDAVIGWLDRRPAGAPFLLWVHVSDPHAPYDPPEPFRGRFGAGHLPPEAGSIQELYRARGGDRPATPREELIDLYDGEIATTDRAFGRLVRRLGAEGLLDETVVFFVADHGEAFQEHGRWQHGNDLHQEQIHVPLIVRLPGARQAGLRVADRVQQIDVFPTLLDLLDLPVPEGVQGRSLLPLLAGGGGGGVDGPPVYSYLAKDGMELSAVIAGHLKLIRDVVYDRERPPRHLYDLAGDPEERFDRWSEEDVGGGYLESLLLRADLRWSTRAPRVRGDLDRELVERLQALGYLR